MTVLSGSTTSLRFRQHSSGVVKHSRIHSPTFILAYINTSNICLFVNKQDEEYMVLVFH